MTDARPEVLCTGRGTHGGPAGSRDERWPVELDFSASLNAWGPAEEVVAAVRAARISEYPDPECLGARRAAAERWGRGIEEIAFGAGAAELLHAIAFAYLRPGDRVVVPSPTFGEYARSAALCGARVVLRRAAPPHWAIGAEELAAAVREHRARLAYLCAPNNPTGEAPGRDEIARVADACAEAGALLVLDQSYDAFLAEPLGTPVLPAHPAVVVVRSVTKDHALAGVRAAFAVASPEIIDVLERVRVPWAASTAAQAAAVAALSPAGEHHLARTLPLLHAERRRIAERLERLAIPTVPSATHFLLVEVGDAAQVADTLRARYRIGVRDCASFGLPAHIRIAARRPEENEVLLRALEAVSSS
ncbi:MAG: histidinol-phosphate aminotransferase family protein [Gemmatimonadetes bacterium]|nr:histidinol-phosphate aminotransferase family protein [Gemmatimonadota bacterium]